MALAVEQDIKHQLWVHVYPVHTTIRVGKDWGLKQIETDSSQSELSVHTTDFNLDWKGSKTEYGKTPKFRLM